MEEYIKKLLDYNTELSNDDRLEIAEYLGSLPKQAVGAEVNQHKDCETCKYDYSYEKRVTPAKCISCNMDYSEWSVRLK